MTFIFLPLEDDFHYFLPLEDDLHYFLPLEDGIRGSRCRRRPCGRRRPMA